MTRQRARAIFEAALQAAGGAGVRDIEVMCGARAAALTRFANNTIHQNVAEQGRWISVRAVIDGRTARASTNRDNPEGIRRVVEEAIALTRSSQPDPDLPTLAEPGACRPVDRFYEATARKTPAGRGAAVAEAIRIVERGAGQTAAGIYSTEESAEALLNSNGVDAYHAETMSTFSITAMAGDSSGWAKSSSPDDSALDPLALARTASVKATASLNPREIPADKYTVILQPAAVLDLVGQIFGDFSGTALQDQRSFLNERVGTQLFGPNVTIEDDAWHPLQSGAPFDGEGVPRKRLKLVEGGVPREVAWSRMAAAKAGVEPTGHGFPLPNESGEMPLNIVIAGGETPLDSMIASSDRVILVTRLWYIREVEPYEKIMTGMTRDGTFLIENGELVCGLRNFRFNQSVVEMLNHVEAMSPPVRASGEESFDMVVPAMKVRDFQFTEVTRF